MRSCLVFGVSLCVGCLGKPGKRRPEEARGGQAGGGE